MNFRKRLKRQNAVLWALLIFTLAMNVVLGVMWDEWFLDPRKMTELARTVQRVAYFGFLAYLILCLVRNYRLLREQNRLEEWQREEQDERRSFVSGAAERLTAQVFTVVLAGAVFLASLMNMAAFAALAAVLAIYAVLRIGTNFYYRRRY